jgi:arylsulfatase A-like enzyme
MKLMKHLKSSAFLIFFFLTAMQAQQKPNFIVILVDDMGFGDMGAYRELYQGGDTKSFAHLHTPELDDLAHDGIICTRAYMASWCAPSRQMLLSGCWINRKSAVDQDFPWIGRRLRQEGYTTGMYGKSHGAHANSRNTYYLDDIRTEFDQGLFLRDGMRGYYLEEGELLPGHHFEKDASYRAKGNEYITDIYTEGATDFIRRNSDSPFFLYLAYTAPHQPIQGKPEDLKMLFPEVFEPLADSCIRARKIPAGMSGVDWNKYVYAAMVYSVDRGLTQIRQALKETGVEDNTVIIFTSDNGAIIGSNYPYTGHKWDVYEGGIRVPFIVWSDAISNSDLKGSVYDGLVSAADIAPTLMALAGNQDLADFDGNNIMPYITGSESPPPESQIFYYREPLGIHQVTAAKTLYPEWYKGMHIMLEAYIQGEEKHLRFWDFDNEKVYERGMALPDVRDVADPGKKLAEDIQGITSGDWTLLSEEEFAGLKKKRNDFLEENETDFYIRWSGAPPRKMN